MQEEPINTRGEKKTIYVLTPTQNTPNHTDTRKQMLKKLFLYFSSLRFKSQRIVSLPKDSYTIRKKTWTELRTETTKKVTDKNRVMKERFQIFFVPFPALLFIFFRASSVPKSAQR